MYIIRNILKFTEEDNFNDGALPSSGAQHLINFNRSNENLSKLIDEVSLFIGEDYYEIDSCGDDSSRIDFQLLENGEGERASKDELKLWKEGKERIWIANYTMNIEKIFPCDIVEDLKECRLKMSD